MFATTAIPVILGGHTNTTYRFAGGRWVAQSMRAGPEPVRPPVRMRVDAKAPSYEGFDAFVLKRALKSADGESLRATVVIPMLNQRLTRLRAGPTAAPSAGNRRSEEAERRSRQPVQGDSVKRPISR